MKTLVSLLLAAAVLAAAPASATTTEYTHVRIVNGTRYWIYVDSYAHFAHVQHWGLIPPNHDVIVEVRHPDMKFFTDVYVYVKRTRTQDPEDTLCTVKKTFGNTTGKPTLVEHVHSSYDGKSCSIDPQ